MRRVLVVTLALFVSVAATATVPNDEAAIVHVLNRIGFGPRPADVEKVRAMGLDRYIDQQLHPERIADAAMPARLSELTTIGMSSREIAERFALPALEAKRQRKQDPSTPLRAGPSTPLKAGAKEDGNQPEAKSLEQERANRVMTELSEQKLLRAIYSATQLQELLTDFWFNHF